MMVSIMLEESDSIEYWNCHSDGFDENRDFVMEHINRLVANITYIMEYPKNLKRQSVSNKEIYDRLKNWYKRGMMHKLEYELLKTGDKNVINDWWNPILIKFNRWTSKIGIALTIDRNGKDNQLQEQFKNRMKTLEKSWKGIF
jgi:hypothetical protein